MLLEKVRKISKNELIYLDMQEISTSFAIQFVFEYQNPIDIKTLENAINEARLDIPDCFVKRSENFWVKDGDNIEIKTLMLDTDDIFNSPVFFEKPDYSRHAFETLYIKNRGRYYLLFRFSHSMVDGKGALLILDNIFARIQGAVPSKCSNLTNDEEFIKNLKCNNKIHPIFSDFHLETPFVKGKNIKFKIFKFPKLHHRVIAKLSLIFIRLFKEQNVKFMVPVDIRRHNDNKNFVPNLVLPIFIDANKKDTIEIINAKLLSKLKEKEELNRYSTDHFLYDKFPEKLRQSALQMLFKIKEMNEGFPIGAIFSYLGKINLEKYSFKDNKALSFCSLPIHQALTPFSVVISETKDETTFSLSYFKEQICSKAISLIEEGLNGFFNNFIDYGFNQTDFDFNSAILNELDKTFGKYAKNIAIIDEEKEYTYFELSKRSDEIAFIMKENGVCYKDKVILYMERSFDFMASILAVLKLGAVYIPVDKTESKFRINQIIETSSFRLLLTNISDVDFNNIKTINLSGFSVQNAPEFSFFNYKNDDEIYNIFTSGTTGSPKGIKINLLNLSNYILWARKTYVCDEKPVMPLFTSLSVDLTVTSVFLPLVSGGCIRIFKEDFNGRILDKIYSDLRINIVKCTPTHLTFLKENPLTKKEWLIVGGENFKSSLISKLKKSNKNIVNEYGPAETTVGSIFYTVNENTVLSDEPTVPIGFPISNTKVYLVRENGEIIKEENVAGEIVIAGDCVSSGYTDNKSGGFKILDPKLFGGEKCYYTGDIGVFKNSLLYCLGRIDHQVKINGRRIELEEINLRLLELNEIQAAETFLIKGRIASFIISKENLSKEDIIARLKDKLPQFMLPSLIFPLQSFPLLESGKIDRAKLLELTAQAPPELPVDTLSGESPVIELIKEKIPDKVFDFKYEKLYDIGLDSMDMLILEQEVAENYLSEDVRDEFFKEYIMNASNLTIESIKTLVKKFGGNL